MKLVAFELDGTTHFGAQAPWQNEILDFSAASCALPQPGLDLDWFNTDSASLQGALALLEELRAAGRDGVRATALRTDGGLLDPARVCMLAPVPRPGKLICIGLNYRDHAEESGLPIPEEPVVFCKFTSAVTGPEAPVFLPRTSNRVDYEAELGVVIGRRCRRVTKEEAFQYVLGFTCINDVSARDLQERDGRWVRAKSLDSFAPMGAAVVTLDEIADPHRLSIRFRLNGETLQDSSTEQLIFGVDELISFLSQDITLEPGDVIATGTPPGVGFARKPPIYLKDGDLMEVEIEGIGVLRNPVRA